MKKIIGYLIPEFPGQTHIFLWREREALIDMGIETELVSTREPAKQIVSHVWADEAKSQTTYLVPFTYQDWWKVISVLFTTSPVVWLKCFMVILKANDVSLSDRIQLLAMVVVGAKLAWLAKDRRWCHMHVHSCGNFANIALFASIITKITYSLTLHGPTLEVYGSNQPQKWKYASFAIIISQKLLKDIKNKLGSFLPSKVLVAPMGVNTDIIKRNNSYVPWQKTETCRIFSCGRLNPIKGHKYLFKTIEILKDQGFNIQLTIAGEDEKGGKGYRQELEKIIGNKNLSDTIVLLGAVSENQIRHELENAHLFVLASLNEGVPVAVMEAMAMEVPIVVTDVGGVSELVDNEVNGLLVKQEKPKEMADKINNILQNPELASALSKKSRQKIIDNFSDKQSAGIIAKLINEL